MSHSRSVAVTCSPYTSSPRKQPKRTVNRFFVPVQHLHKLRRRNGSSSLGDGFLTLLSSYACIAYEKLLQLKAMRPGAALCVAAPRRRVWSVDATWHGRSRQLCRAASLILAQGCVDPVVPARRSAGRFNVQFRRYMIFLRGSNTIRRHARERRDSRYSILLAISYDLFESILSGTVF